MSLQRRRRPPHEEPRSGIPAKSNESCIDDMLPAQGLQARCRIGMFPSCSKIEERGGERDPVPGRTLEHPFTLTAPRFPNQTEGYILEYASRSSHSRRESDEVKQRKLPARHSVGVSRSWSRSRCSRTMQPPNGGSRKLDGAKRASRLTARIAVATINFGRFHPGNPCPIGAVPVVAISAFASGPSCTGPASRSASGLSRSVCGRLRSRACRA